MNDDEARALGMRAVACKGWRWMAGMRLVSAGGWRVNSGGEGVVMRTRDGWATVYEECWGAAIRGELLPDLRDPATLGCMLALVRGTWNRPHLVVIHDTDHPSGLCGPWFIWTSDGWVDGAVEASSLVAALEAAPEVEP